MVISKPVIILSSSVDEEPEPTIINLFHNLCGRALQDLAHRSSSDNQPLARGGVEFWVLRLLRQIVGASCHNRDANEVQSRGSSGVFVNDCDRGALL